MSHMILLYSLVKHCAAAATGAYVVMFITAMSVNSAAGR